MTDVPVITAETTGHLPLALRLGRYRETGLVVATIALIALVGAFQPRFLSASNIHEVLLSVSILVIIVVGQTLVVLTRNVDLSIGSVVGFAAFATGAAFKAHAAMAVPVAVLLGCGIGLALGAFNGLLVAFGRAPAIVATLGTRAMFRGLLFLIAGGSEITASDLPDRFVSLSEWLIVFAVVIVVVFAYALRYMRSGRELYAVGSNPDAARLAGLPINLLVFGAFVISGFLGGLAGVLWASRLAMVNATAASGLELQVIAAVVVGGVNIFGGSGSIAGAVLGTILLGLIENALTLLHFNPFWLQAIYGIAILAAVTLDASVMRRLQSLARARRAA